MELSFTGYLGGHCWKSLESQRMTVGRQACSFSSLRVSRQLCYPEILPFGDKFYVTIKHNVGLTKPYEGIHHTALKQCVKGISDL